MIGRACVQKYLGVVPVDLRNIRRGKPEERSRLKISRDNCERSCQGALPNHSLGRQVCWKHEQFGKKGSLLGKHGEEPLGIPAVPEKYSGRYQIAGTKNGPIADAAKSGRYCTAGARM